MQVQHPHVVQFHYCLQSESRIFLVMEYIRGGSLKSILNEHKPPIQVGRLALTSDSAFGPQQS